MHDYISFPISTKIKSFDTDYSGRCADTLEIDFPETLITELACEVVKSRMRVFNAGMIRSFILQAILRQGLLHSECIIVTDIVCTNKAKNMEFNYEHIQ